MQIWAPGRRVGVVLMVVGGCLALLCGVLFAIQRWGPVRGSGDVAEVTAGPVTTAPTPTPTPELTKQDRERVEMVYWVSIAAMESSMTAGHRSLPDRNRASMTREFAEGYDRALERQARTGLRPVVGSDVQIGSIDGAGDGQAVVHSCEDSTPVRYRNRDGQELKQKDPVRQYVTYTFTKVGPYWRLSDASAEEVSEFSGPHACA